MNHDDLCHRLVEVGIRFVSYRPRSNQEMVLYLQKKAESMHDDLDTCMQYAINRLLELGYIDDVAFTDWWIHKRTVYRPKGMRVIKAELRQKGISDEIINERLSFMKSDEMPQARRLAQKKAVQWRKMPILERKKKMYMYFGSRGFSSDTIHRIIDELEQVR